MSVREAKLSDGKVCLTRTVGISVVPAETNLSLSPVSMIGLSGESRVMVKP